MPDNSDNAVISIVDDVIKVSDAITKAKAALDVINPGRSVIMSIVNATDQQMILTNTSFDHGDWGIPPKAVTPPNTTLVFGAKSDGFLTGTSGHVFFAIGNTEFDVYWDNPYLGGNSADMHVSGHNPLDFAIHFASGAGNQDAQYIYQIYQQVAPFGAMLVNKHSGMALDIPGFSTDDNVLIQQYPINGGVNQRWIFKKLGGDGTNSIYSLANQGSQKCMDVPGGSTDPQVKIQQFKCHGGPDQQWRFTPAEDGFFVIYNVNSGLCLDIPGLSTDWGTLVQQFGFNNGTNQKWRVQWQ